MAMRSSKVGVCLGAALLLVALFMAVAPALAHACHGGHAAAATASSIQPARHTATHHHDTLPCCIGSSCADLVPLPGAGCPAAPPARTGTAYTPAGTVAVNGFDPSPAPPPPRHAH